MSILIRCLQTVDFVLSVSLVRPVNLMCDIVNTQRNIYGCLGGSDLLKRIMLISNAGSLSNKQNDVTHVTIFVVEEGEEIVFSTENVYVCRKQT